MEDETTPMEKAPVTLQKRRMGSLGRSEQLTQEKLLEPRGWGRSMIVVSLKVGLYILHFEAALEFVSVLLPVSLTRKVM